MSTKYVGLSFSLCVQAILEGKIPLSNVAYIVPGFRWTGKVDEAYFETHWKAYPREDVEEIIAKLEIRDMSEDEEDWREISINSSKQLTTVQDFNHNVANGIWWPEDTFDAEVLNNPDQRLRTQDLVFRDEQPNKGRQNSELPGNKLPNNKLPEKGLPGRSPPNSAQLNNDQLKLVASSFAKAINADCDVGSDAVVINGVELSYVELEDLLKPSNRPSIGMSESALSRHFSEQGYSYTTWDPERVCQLAVENWPYRKPGTGRTDFEKVVLVPVRDERLMSGFFPPRRVTPVMRLPVQAEVVRRHPEEDPHVENYVLPEDAEILKAVDDRVIAKTACEVDLVCYSASVLEKNGDRTTACEWEIVAINCRQSGEVNFLSPLEMARDFLERAGGVFADYSATQFAEAIWYQSMDQGIIIRNHKEA